MEKSLKIPRKVSHSPASSKQRRQGGAKCVLSKVAKCVLSAVLVLTLMPAISRDSHAYAHGETAPSASAWANVANLESTFLPGSDGLSSTTAKIKFGQNDATWYVLGKDEGVTGDNAIIVAAKSLKSSIFESGGSLFPSGPYTKSVASDTDFGVYLTTAPTTVAINHYGASKLRDTLQSMTSEGNTDYFSATEKSMLNETTITTYDEYNKLSYTTTDKLYPGQGNSSDTVVKFGSSDQISLAPSSAYWQAATAGAWLRTAWEEIASGSHQSVSVIESTQNNVEAFYVSNGFCIMPAANLNLSKVLFASAAEGSTSTSGMYSTIASTVAMTLRLNGEGKNFGYAYLDTETNSIWAGNTSSDENVEVSLVVQGKTDNNDWYFSKLIKGNEIITNTTIADMLGQNTVDLENCKIWVETTDADGTIYALNPLDEKPATCKVTFNCNDDNSTVKEEEVVTGSTVSAPTGLTKAGYELEGWYESSDFSGAAYDFDTPVSGVLTLYAKWTKVKSVNEINVGASVITVPEGGWNTTSGNYLYFGSTYVGSTTNKDGIKFRVLKNEDGKMLIDADSNAFYCRWNADQTNTWTNDYDTCNIKSYLSRGYGYNTYTKKEFPLFTDQELKTIPSTDLEAASEYEITNSNSVTYSFVDATSLGNKAFLLSAQEANDLYADEAARFKKSSITSTGMTYPLRSEHTSGSETAKLAAISSENDKGTFTHEMPGSNHLISPAANISTSGDNSTVFLSMDNAFDKTQSLSAVQAMTNNTWRLTLKDSTMADLELGIATQETTAEGSVVSVPYKMADCDATQISLAITSGELSDSATDILYYGKLVDKANIASGTATFTLPENLPDGYKIYVFPEQVCSANYTDYAGDPVEVEPVEEGSYLVKFVDWDTTVLKSEIVDEGTAATAPDAPEREGYVFIGWDPADFTNVTEHMTITAKYDKQKYSVKFVDWNGELLEEQSVEFEGAATAPVKEPAREGYIFIGWNPADFSNVTANMTIRAMYLIDAEPKDWTRLAGSNRYDTNAAIVGDGDWTRGGVVMLATGENFPDALAVSGLAGMCDAPVLLTSTNELPDRVQAQLEYLAPKRVYILGSPNAISEEVEKTVQSLCSDAKVERIGGTNRKDTALKIYEKGLELEDDSDIVASGWENTAIVTWGDGFADALSVSPAAYEGRFPVFLTNSDGTLDEEYVNAIKEGEFARVLFLGGTNRVADSVKDALESDTLKVVRLEGSNRIETSTTIAKWANENVGAQYDGMIVATGSRFPDALGGGALAGSRNTVLVLVEDSDAGTYAADEIVKKNAADINWGTFLGDENSVSKRVADYFIAASKE